MLVAEDIRNVLREILDPELNISIVDQGMINDIIVIGGRVVIVASSSYAGTPMVEYLSEVIKQKIEALPEVDSVVVEFTGK
jgi:metal-sulfur cluster biosynthetic enzyme